MGRLTKTWEENESKYICLTDCEERCKNGGVADCTCNINTEVWKKLSHYEDLEEQGRLIELPCKVGNTVWKISECSAPSCEKCFNFKMNMTNDCYHDYKARIVELSFGIYMVFHFGETVFLTKEEAEAKLKELKEGVE